MTQKINTFTKKKCTNLRDSVSVSVSACACACACAYACACDCACVYFCTGFQTYSLCLLVVAELCVPLHPTLCDVPFSQKIVFCCTVLWNRKICRVMDLNVTLLNESFRLNEFVDGIICLACCMIGTRVRAHTHTTFCCNVAHTHT